MKAVFLPRQKFFKFLWKKRDDYSNIQWNGFQQASEQLGLILFSIKSKDNPDPDQKLE